MTHWNIQNPALKNMQGVDKGCFQHRNSNFGHTYLGMPKSDLKPQFSTIPDFFIKSAMYSEHNNQ